MSLINKRVTLAACRLALFYTAFVALEILALWVASAVNIWLTIRELFGVSVLLMIPFAGAFLLLALARRLGLVAFWIILIGLWVLPFALAKTFPTPLLFPLIFLSWSILALPLWVIGQVGIPRRSSFGLGLGPVRISPSMALLACWVFLLAGVRLFGSLADYPEMGVLSIRIAEPLAWIWGVAPLLLSAFAIQHVWRGTAKPVTA